jgi:hypothetical protein
MVTSRKGEPPPVAVGAPQPPVPAEPKHDTEVGRVLSLSRASEEGLPVGYQ